jgi:regulatory protein
VEDNLKQAKLKALSLLTDMDRTEAQLRQKLRDKSYENDVIDKTIEYVKSFGYIDDAKYAQRFVENRKRTKSRQEISALLSQKGVRRDIIAETLEACYSSEDAVEAIRYLIEKKHYEPEKCSDKEKKKIYDYLLRKGFFYDDIRHVIQVSFWNA